MIFCYGMSSGVQEIYELNEVFVITQIFSFPFNCLIEPPATETNIRIIKQTK